MNISITIEPELFDGCHDVENLGPSYKFRGKGKLIHQQCDDDITAPTSPEPFMFPQICEYSDNDELDDDNNDNHMESSQSTESSSLYLQQSATSLIMTSSASISPTSPLSIASTGSSSESSIISEMVSSPSVSWPQSSAISQISPPHALETGALHSDIPRSDTPRPGNEKTEYYYHQKYDGNKWDDANPKWLLSQNASSASVPPSSSMISESSSSPSFPPISPPQPLQTGINHPGTPRPANEKVRCYYHRKYDGNKREDINPKWLLSQKRYRMVLNELFIQIMHQNRKLIDHHYHFFSDESDESSDDDDDDYYDQHRNLSIFNDVMMGFMFHVL